MAARRPNDVPFSGDTAASGTSILHRLLAAGSSAATAGWTALQLEFGATPPPGRDPWFRELDGRHPRSLTALAASRNFGLPLVVGAPEIAAHHRPNPPPPSAQSVQRLGVNARARQRPSRSTPCWTARRRLLPPSEIVYRSVLLDCEVSHHNSAIDPPSQHTVDMVRSQSCALPVPIFVTSNFCPVDPFGHL